ncbi:MAG: nucleoside monophosphate kinase [Planctomycetota bacterium]|nr:nucleoside monophosphate kinase [Planctomycetota bacterium]
MNRPQAILLLGPTGSGKTPLGECLAARGLRGRPCAHFDFGRQLRDVTAADPPPAGFSREEVDFLRDVLERGALLENRHFPLAEKILRAFLAERAAPGSLIILNGLPRHVDQARDAARLLDVGEVVVLHCPPQVVLERIASDAGGDRAGRMDDSEAAVRAKLELFAQRTAPLVEYYRAAGAAVRTVEVGPATTPDDVLAALNAVC